MVNSYLSKISEYHASFQIRLTHFKKQLYIPGRILPVFSKIFEKLLSRQLSEFFDNILSKFQ